jgi:hypothetical protein
MGSLLGLIPLVTSVLPSLIPLMATPMAGNVLTKAADIAEKIFGTKDPTAIAAQMAAAESAAKVEEFKAKLEAATEEERLYYADIQNARAQTVELAKMQSPLAWGAPVMTGLVTVGFFMVLIIFIAHALALSEFQQAVLNVLVGYLGAAFSQAVNYWLGSTKGSKDKDNMLASLASTATTTVRDVAANGAKKMFK